MKSIPHLLLSAALLAGAVAGNPAAAAGTGLAMGAHVTPAELSAIDGAARYDVGGASVTVLPADRGITAKSTDGATQTTVVNANGTVGISRNEVLVAQIPTDTVRAQAGALIAAARTVSYYDNLQITSLRYASFAQAVAGREKLQAAFPKAQVTLPVDYHQRKPR